MSETGSRGHLLDTHVILWALTEPERLSDQARAIVLGGGCFLSVVSYWEIAMKCMKGTLEVGDPRALWAEAVREFAAIPLNLRPDHIGALLSLAHHHKDPFDRILIAQALVERLILVSSDKAMAKYATGDLRIVL